MSLRKKTISGLLWTFTQQFSVQGINVIVSIILARLLLPSVFGLIGMLTIFIALGVSLMDSGMTSSLIRTHDADQNDYSTVFFINLIFSILIYIILFFSAPLIARFYNQPILDPVLKVYTISFIIRAFVGVQTTKLTKEMRFKEQMFMQIPSTIIGGTIGILLAYNGYGVWSLVWMNLVQSFLFTLQHWIFSGWVPSLLIDKSKLKYHLHFGYKLTFAGLIDTIYENIYKVIIGKFFPVTELGYYTQAKNLQMMPVNNISMALSKVTYPMFVSIKDDNIKLKSTYKKLLQQVIFWISPLMILAIVIAKPLFLLLLTAKWLPAVPYFQILCVSGILYPFHSYNLNILNVKGRSDLFLKLEIIKKAFITIGIMVAMFYGIYGLLYFQIISSIFAYWVNTYYSGKFIDYSGLQQLKGVMPILLVSSLVGFVLWIIKDYALVNFNLSNFIMVLLLSFLYLIFYLGLSRLVKISALEDFKLLILKR